MSLATTFTPRSQKYLLKLLHLQVAITPLILRPFTCCFNQSNGLILLIRSASLDSEIRRQQPVPWLTEAPAAPAPLTRPYLTPSFDLSMPATMTRKGKGLLPSNFGPGPRKRQQSWRTTVPPTPRSPASPLDMYIRRPGEFINYDHLDRSSVMNPLHHLASTRDKAGVNPDNTHQTFRGLVVQHVNPDTPTWKTSALKEVKWARSYSPTP